MGARLKVRVVPVRWDGSTRDYAIDVRRDRHGELFELRVPTHLSETVEATVLQSEPKVAFLD